MSRMLTVFQEHSEVLACWAARGWRKERLLVFDEHLDLKAIETSRVDKLDRALRAGADINAFNRRSLLGPVDI